MNSVNDPFLKGMKEVEDCWTRAPPGLGPYRTPGGSRQVSGHAEDLSNCAKRAFTDVQLHGNLSAISDENIWLQ